MAAKRKTTKRKTKKFTPTQPPSDPDRLWEIADRRMKEGGGRPRIFETPEELWAAASDYFRWLERNSLEEEKLFHYQGRVTRDRVRKMRAATFAGLWVFIGLTKDAWYNYTKRDGFVEVCKLIDIMIREQKFTGAAAELLNPSIIARDLGLKEHVSTEHDSTEQFGELLKALGQELPD